MMVRDACDWINAYAMVVPPFTPSLSYTSECGLISNTEQKSKAIHRSRSNLGATSSPIDHLLIR